MDVIKLWIGSVKDVSGGHVVDSRRPVEFEAETVGSFRTLTGDSDTRGVKQTLYRAVDGRLVVHVENWSRWQGEPTTTSLRQVNQADLDVNGEFEELGRECGFGRSLTLDEALDTSSYEVEYTPQPKGQDPRSRLPHPLEEVEYTPQPKGQDPRRNTDEALSND